MDKNIILMTLDLPRPVKRIIVMVVDGGLAVFTVWLAYYLRVGQFLPLAESTTGWVPLPACILAVASSIPIFMLFGLYRVIFRYVELSALVAVSKAVLVYAIVFAFVFTVFGVEGVPRTIGIIQPILFFIFVSLSRFVARFWLSGMYVEHFQQNKKPCSLIYGAGEAGRALSAALAHSPVTNVVGFLDDDPKLQGSHVSGLPVYNPSNFDRVIAQRPIREIMLALPRVSRRRRNEILQLLRGQNVIVRTLPSFSDLAQGRVTVNDVRELSIEDVLGRDVVAPEPKLMKRDIKGKTVMVTGAGGSIGSELCRQILRQAPKKLVLFDHSEYALYSILTEVENANRAANNKVAVTAILGSVTDKQRLQQVFSSMTPDTVFHAAAYKHVPLVEDNMFEGINNNLFGTLFTSQAAIEVGVKKFVLISTDKAVRPTNIMGASKRLAELTLQALSTEQTKTVFAMVRFGNVLGSSGSVVPLFRQQIKDGGPVTLTHIDVTRYFMTISEAAQLVIQAGAMTQETPKPGQAAPVYLLDMGQPVKIYNLARRIIELSGLTIYDPATGDGDIEIKITGLRSGEKLHEELLIGDAVSGSAHPKIKFADEMFLCWPEFNKHLKTLAGSVSSMQTDKTLEIITGLVAGFGRSQNSLSRSKR